MIILYLPTADRPFLSRKGYDVTKREDVVCSGNSKVKFKILPKQHGQYILGYAQLNANKVHKPKNMLINKQCDSFVLSIKLKYICNKRTRARILRKQYTGH